MDARYRCGRMLVQRPRWGLSLRGRLVVLVGCLFIGIFGVRAAYPFLAVNEPVNARYLVVEGWIHEYALKAAIDEFERGGYKLILTTGGPVQGTGQYTNDFNTSASVAAERLVSMGLSPSLVQVVPSRVIDRDRTYSSAMALRAWLEGQSSGEKSLNVLTEDLHARRTRLLYQKAFSNRMEIGIIPVTSPDYDSRHWWRYSEGVREVLGEGIAYLYARLFFYPSRK